MHRLVGVACSLAALLGPVSCGSVSPRAAPVAPVADHHAHLLSPAGAQHISEPLQATIALPAALSPLVGALEAGWNDEAALSAVLAEDCLVLSSRDPGWIRGRAAAAEFLAGLFAKPYRLAPVACAVDGSEAHVAGYVTRVLEGGSVSRFGHVLLALRRPADGAWQVAAATLTFPGPVLREPMPADQLVAQLDEAGIRKAAVLSVAYWFAGRDSPPGVDEQAEVRRENDWTIEQVGRYPERLVAFCSVNPLKSWAIDEIDRCAKLPHVAGLKLHFGNSWVDVRDPAHVEKLRQVFAAADERGLAIVAHLWTDPDYGREEAQIFLERILPAAPHVPVQVAHFAGGGPGYTDAALEVFANAIAAGDPRTRHLGFDIATVADGQPREVLQVLAARIRQVGVDRVFYGTDMAPPVARTSWLVFRTTVPLTEEELAAIAANEASYFH